MCGNIYSSIWNWAEVPARTESGGDPSISWLRFARYSGIDLTLSFSRSWCSILVWRSCLSIFYRRVLTLISLSRLTYLFTLWPIIVTFSGVVKSNLSFDKWVREVYGASIACPIGINEKPGWPLAETGNDPLDSAFKEVFKHNLFRVPPEVLIPPFYCLRSNSMFYSSIGTMDYFLESFFTGGYWRFWIRLRLKWLV